MPSGRSVFRLVAVAGTALSATFAALRPADAQTLVRSGPVPHDSVRERELLSQVKAPDGFRVSLFAGPPVAMYPTCLTGTIDGALFVCVDPNLSLSATKGVGRVVRLVDTNQDGAADQYTVFAEMDSPRGLAFDGKTLYVMHPPTLTAYRDTTGDGIADVSEVLVKGLGFDLDFRGADHTTNGITLAIDGWIYIAAGDYGYRNAVGKDGTVIAHRGGTVVRVRTDGSGLEIYARGTRNMYDLAVDPFLHVFSRDNTNDGDGWDTRLHYMPPGANMGYPALYKNFPTEHFASLADYGSGAGTGGLWVHDPGFPDGFGNTLYTADWTVNRILRHPLRPKGASYEAEQETFLSLPHPSDMTMDGMSNMYVASLSGGSFNYIGDTVGYVVRVNYAAGPASKPPVIAAQNDASLVALLASPTADYRLQAQREILRRGERRGVVQGLTTLTLDRRKPAFARVAAMFTLKQLVGERSHKTIQQAAADPAMTALALRALSDHPGQLRDVTAATFVKYLSDTSAQVQLAAIAALQRVNARDAAPSIIPLTGSPDAGLAHIAVNALVSLGARDAALAGVRSVSPAVRAGSLRVLQQMHDSTTVTTMIDLLAGATEPALQRDLIVALARLYNREAVWTGDWWGTRPSFIGPYFAPTVWESSSRIGPLLRRALVDAPVDELTTIVDEFVRNRVLPQGAKALVLATASDVATRTQVVDALLGSAQLTPAALPLLTQLHGQGGAASHGVSELLAAESGIVEGALPIVRQAALDTTLDQEARRKLLNLVGAMTGRPAIDGMAKLFAQVNPTLAQAANPDGAGPVEAAWRRYVGDRRRLQELDYFVDLSRGAQPEHRTLAFSVLLQSVRGNRVAADVTARVAPVLDAAFSSREASPDLERAITVMRLNTQYAARLDSLHARTTATQPAMDWTPLFNGKDLKDWEIKFTGYPVGENFRNTFRVEEGLLQVRYDQWSNFAGEFGHLFYKQPFSHYIVAAEYRFVGEQVTGAGSGLGWAVRNNGFMLHSQSAASMGLRQDFPISLEVQFLGGLGQGTRTTGNLCTPGTNVVMNDRLITAHCTNSSSLTYGGDQWVRVEAMVLGDSVIKHIVNGDTVLTYSKPQMGGGQANNTNPGVLVNGQLLSSGFIALQAESAPIDFRKVEIVNLAGCMDPKARNYKTYFVKSDPAACKK